MDLLVVIAVTTIKISSNPVPVWLLWANDKTNIKNCLVTIKKTFDVDKTMVAILHKNIAYVINIVRLKSERLLSLMSSKTLSDLYEKFLIGVRHPATILLDHIHEDINVKFDVLLEDICTIFRPPSQITITELIVNQCAID